MSKFLLKTKIAWVTATVVSVIFAGSVATVSAARHDPPSQGNGGYAIDQCADGRWKTFKNPDGSQKFKNQGQCVAFFATQQESNGFGNAFPGFGQLISSIINAVLHFLGNFF